MMETDEEIRAVRARRRMRDNDRLRGDLERISEVGWEHPVATALLGLVRERLVRPVVVAEGLRGLAAWQAEASGWAAAWETLRSPGLRDARSPWGVLWTVVLREVRAEVMSAHYCTGLRRAWRARGPGGASPTPAVVSLDRMLDAGLEPTPARGSLTPMQDAAGGLDAALEAIVGAMGDTGWHRAVAVELVAAIAEVAERETLDSRRKLGRRTVAEELGLPPWQVRRVTVLLLGEPGWDGLLVKIRRGGPDVLADVGVIAAVRSTVVEWMRPPRRVAALAVEAGLDPPPEVCFVTGQRTSRRHGPGHGASGGIAAVMAPGGGRPQDQPGRPPSTDHAREVCASTVVRVAGVMKIFRWSRRSRVLERQHRLLGWDSANRPKGVKWADPPACGRQRWREVQRGTGERR